MFSIFFEKYAKICRFSLSFNHDSAADWIYSLFFARNNLMNIMCKVGDYIQKVNNIAKTSTQTNTQKRSTQKTDDSIANNQKKQKITESEVEIEVKNEVKRNYVLGTQDNTKDVLVIPLLTNKVKSSQPCKQNPSIKSFFLIFFVFLQIYCANMGVEHGFSSYITGA